MYSNADMSNRIIIERKKLGLTREQLSEQIGVTPYYLGQIERGDRAMGIETLIKLCDALRVSIDYLIKGQEKTPASNDELQALISKCTVEEQAMLVDILKAALPHMNKQDK